MKLLCLLTLILSTTAFAQYQNEWVFAFEAGTAQIVYNNSSERIEIHQYDGEGVGSSHNVDCDELEAGKNCYEVFRDTKLHLEKIQRSNLSEKLAITLRESVDYSDYYNAINKDEYLVNSNNSLIKVINEQLYLVSDKLEAATLLLKQTQSSLASTQLSLSQTEEDLTEANKRILEEQTKMKFVKQVIEKVGKRKGKKILKAIKEAGYDI